MKNIILVLLSTFFLGCSSTQELPFLTQESKVERTSAIVIARITFEDEYTDPDAMEMKTFDSRDLLEDKERIAERRKNIGKSQLWTPLYYLANFRLFLQETGKDEGVTIVRFNNDLSEYDETALHPIAPGEYEWNHLTMTGYRFNGHGPAGEVIRWEPNPMKFPFPYKKWTFEPGKIYYIGDIRFFFKTKKFIFGWYPREAVVEKFEMTHLNIRNHFEEMKEVLGKEKPWFPTDQIINLAENKDFFPQDGQIREGKVEKEEEKKDEVRDKEKYFF